MHDGRIYILLRLPISRMKMVKIIKDNAESGNMPKKEVSSAISGLSYLKFNELEKYAGECLAIIDGKVRAHNKNPIKIMDFLKRSSGKEKIFSSVPLLNEII